jgi:hypothetical protein
MNINWMKIGKACSIVLPIVAGTIGAVVNSKENEKTTIETTKKLFEEYVEHNK